MIRPVRPIGPDDLGLWCERADGEADKENRADAKRETEDADLADKVAQSDGQEGRQNWLASDDIASKVQHVRSPQIECASLAYATARGFGIVR